MSFGSDHRTGTTGGSAAGDGEPPDGPSAGPSAEGGSTPEKRGTDRCATRGTTGPAAGAGGTSATGVPAAVARWIGTGGRSATDWGWGWGWGAAGIGAGGAGDEGGTGPLSAVRTSSGSSPSSGLDTSACSASASAAPPTASSASSSGTAAPVLAAGVRCAVGGSPASGSPRPTVCGRGGVVAAERRWTAGGVVSVSGRARCTGATGSAGSWRIRMAGGRAEISGSTTFESAARCKARRGCRTAARRRHRHRRSGAGRTLDSPSAYQARR
ncbi:hypothetical protein SAZ11_06335 [Streptomyces sp. FXJ1.4098]|nr:hypothetical protein [Streptomyces sp. FXJ1.4098]